MLDQENKVVVYLDNDLKEFLKDKKANHGQTYSWIVNKAVRELMKKTKKGEAT